MSQGGALTSGELQAQLGVSQPTVSRALAPLIQSGEVQKVGAARKQCYVLPRTVRDVGRAIPVVRIDAQGRPSPFARMVPLASGAMWVDEEDGLSKRLDGLPGNLVVGEPAFERFHTLHQRASRAASTDDYPALAEAAMHGTLSGSSAGQSAGHHVLGRRCGGREGVRRLQARCSRKPKPYRPLVPVDIKLFAINFAAFGFVYSPSSTCQSSLSLRLVSHPGTPTAGLHTRV